MLNGALVLLAEDEPFIAMDVALAIEDAGGIVVGPASSVKEALALIEARPIAAAILDVNLIDGDVTPVAEAIIRLGIPAIFQSGIGLPPALSARYPYLEVYTKPWMAEALVERLAELITKHEQATRSNNKSGGS